MSLVLDLDISRMRYLDDFSSEESFAIGSGTDDRQNFIKQFALLQQHGSMLVACFLLF